MVQSWFLSKQTQSSTNLRSVTKVSTTLPPLVSRHRNPLKDGSRFEEWRTGEELLVDVVFEDSVGTNVTVFCTVLVTFDITGGGSA